MSLIDVYNTERELTKVLYCMERRGFLADGDYCVEALAYEQLLVTATADEFKTFTGREFKDSNKLFKEVFDDMGLKYPVTAKGNPSFNAASLESVDNEVARIIKKHRNHEKRAGTYYSSFIHYADSQGYIHASANQAGTTSGRLSYSNPNLQNVPKEDEPDDAKKAYVVRKSFIPTGRNALVSIDYDQQEYRMMLDYAGEMQLVNKIMEGADVHQATADMMGVTRKYAKTINFALLYGAGIQKLADMLGVSYEEAQDLKKLYFSTLPNVRRFLHQVKAAGEARGYVFNWLGRRCHINKFDESYRLPNHLIQGGCADVMKRAMVKIHHELGEVGMCVQVHDELVFDMPHHYLDKIPRIKEIMEEVYIPKNGMKLTASVDHSFDSWASRDQVKGAPC